MLVADVDGKSGQIAAGDLPLVVLLGEDCSMSLRTAARFGKMPTTSVRRLISLLRRSWGLFDQTCLSVDRGKGNDGQDVGSRVDQQFGGLGEALIEHAHHARVLRVHLLR